MGTRKMHSSRFSTSADPGSLRCIADTGLLQRSCTDGDAEEVGAVKAHGFTFAVSLCSYDGFVN